jgi:hypothetical protein
MLAYVTVLVSSGEYYDTLKFHYLRRSVEDNVVHPDVHLVQKSIVYEVAPFRFLVEQAPLCEEAFQAARGKGVYAMDEG